MAAAMLAAVCEACTMFEFLPASGCASPLRCDLALPEAVREHGRLTVSDAPGLGVTLHRDALARSEAAAARIPATTARG